MTNYPCKATARFALVCIVLIHNFLVAGCKTDVNVDDYKSAIHRGNLIVSALEKYKTRNGDLPDQLEQLVPVFIDTVPKTGIPRREEFVYLKLPKDSNKPYEYTLSFYIDTSIPDFMLLSTRSRGRVTYNTAKAYGKTDAITTHKVIDGWAYQTISR